MKYSWPWPRTLFGRLTLILFFGLIAAQLLSFGLVFYERTQASLSMMINFASRDVASSVAILERLPTAERGDWIDKLARRNYTYSLNTTEHEAPLGPGWARQVAHSIIVELRTNYVVTATAVPNDRNRVHLHLHLHDGTPLTIELLLSAIPISQWVLFLLALQFCTLILVSWLAVRQATRPLKRLAQAADALGPNLNSGPLAEDGPLEVARAAIAFNAMQYRIASYLNERIQFLAAISHDLQTPITRMRLRADLLDDIVLRDKLHGDLSAMQILVQASIAYARDGQGLTEVLCYTDLNALLDSLVCDYADAGAAVRLTGNFHRPLYTRPQALRRIVTNLIDNALKFGSEPEILIAAESSSHVVIAVHDFGPGIPTAELNAVLQPFYRVESSRNHETSGTGLGLAIAQQLALALQGTLTLSNRDSGGLEARLVLPSNVQAPL